MLIPVQKHSLNVFFLPHRLHIVPTGKEVHSKTTTVCTVLVAHTSFSTSSCINLIQSVGLGVNLICPHHTWQYNNTTTVCTLTRVCLQRTQEIL